MLCPSCQSENAEQATYCSHCGATLTGPGPGGPPPVTYAAVDSGYSEVPPDQRNWATICHALVFAGYVIPFGNIIGPLVVWLMKKDEMPYVDDQGKEMLNFQISITIYMIISIVLLFVVIGFFTMLATGIFSIVMTIIAMVKANRGEYVRFPLCIRFIK